jgi:2-polyprenyl-3-methyl-5-hydroxy-6-metoxy-1,4-benzoquinol methylase
MSFRVDRYVTLNQDQTEAEHDPFTPDRYRQFAALIKPQAPRVLDVGCSTGTGGRALKECIPGASLVGMDCVQARVEAVPAEVYDETMIAFSTDLPADDDSFDAVVAGEFIEHVTPADVDPTLAEFFRVLKLGGVLLLTTPNPHYLRHVAAPILGRLKAEQRVLGGAHVSQHFPGTLRLRLRMTGFSGIRIRGTGRVSNVIGQRFPVLPVYGSYLVLARKW